MKRADPGRRFRSATGVGCYSASRGGFNSERCACGRLGGCGLRLRLGLRVGRGVRVRERGREGRGGLVVIAILVLDVVVEGEGVDVGAAAWGWFEVRASRRTYWARVGPEMARMRGRATKRLSLIESLRSDNEAGGPFPAQPEGTRGLGASYVVAPPQRLDTA